MINRYSCCICLVEVIASFSCSWLALSSFEKKHKSIQLASMFFLFFKLSLEPYIGTWVDYICSVEKKHSCTCSKTIVTYVSNTSAKEGHSQTSTHLGRINHVVEKTNKKDKTRNTVSFP